jgi:hypothetical protein
MTLLDAKQYDDTVGRRRRRTITWSLIAVLLAAWVVYHLRHYPERVAVNKFFSAVQKQDFESAYGIWFNDPNWRQHPQKYSNYQFNDFYRDWGPGGEWGLVKTYSVDCSLSPGSSGVIVQATVNGRADHPYVWVQKADKTLSFSPNEIQCGNWWAWVVE